MDYPTNPKTKITFITNCMRRLERRFIDQSRRQTKLHQRNIFTGAACQISNYRG
jgi:hypothetical protein